MRRIVALLWLTLLWIAAVGAFWLHSTLLVVIALGLAGLIATTASLVVARSFRAELSQYHEARKPGTSPSSISLMGRVQTAAGNGFGITRLIASPDGIYLRVLGGLVGNYWFPASELAQIQVIDPSIGSGFVSSLRWATRSSSALSFAPWFGDVNDLYKVLVRTSQ